MSEIRKVMALTGLSGVQLAAWLGVSRALLLFADKGKRGLPQEAIMKLSAMTLMLEQAKAASAQNNMDKPAFTDPVKLAERHRQKMKFHQRSAASLQRKLKKLQILLPQLQSRLVLFEAMNSGNEFYQPRERDKIWMGFIEGFTHDRIPSADLEQQELLQDNIETHLAYAELHRGRMEGFLV